MRSPERAIPRLDGRFDLLAYEGGEGTSLPRFIADGDESMATDQG